MHPTEILSAEHRVIESILDSLVVLCRRARTTGRLDAEHAGSALEVLRAFGDRCHHGKEEEGLFPMLLARGMSTERGPIAVMLDDHRAGREHLRDMARACEAEDVESFAAAATAYVALLRDHIAKEDTVLFPMAESMLDGPARAALLESFRCIERDRLEQGERERMLALADELARLCAVPPASERAAPEIEGCGFGPGCP